MEFRTLKANEIDVRVGSVMQNGATLLLYKDARCDMAILDETVGMMNWKREHLRDNANCVVSLYDDKKKEWVGKEDTGTESFTEREKGLASDSFKRACVNWGIGRELYTAPRIKINCDTQKKQNGKGYELSNPWEFWGAYVEEIGYDENRCINRLVICKDGNNLFEYGEVSKEDLIKEVKKLLEEKNMPPEPVLASAEVNSFEEMYPEQLKNAIERLKITGRWHD